ncbi:MAG: type II toxin-antitoxin system ParD family antitoxin, partial [Bacteroidales bacterium]|nr:type II toxin-antitoxin system ParD family antitoxin [Bacteroidales bacterium]
RRLEEDESRLIALKNALEEGESSPDVTDFDAKEFLKELKAEKKKNG